MTIDNDDDLAGLKRASAAVKEALVAMSNHVAPGVSTLELDALGKEILTKHGANSAPYKAYKFPGTTCISVNDALAHGIPSDQILKEGDLINIDVSAELDGYWSDTGASMAVGKVPARVQELLFATKSARDEAIAEVRAGRPINVIGKAVEKRAKRHRFRVVKDLGGHGVGRHIHEDPHVDNYYKFSNRKPLWEGLVMTIEPFLTFSTEHVYEDDDGWTLRTTDGCLGAQFEHTFVVTKGAPIILT